METKELETLLTLTVKFKKFLRRDNQPDTIQERVVDFEKVVKYHLNKRPGSIDIITT